jgi:tRNA(fMet)-specific endonuclease VapC
MMAGRFLASVEILPWTSREAEAYARLLVEMRAKGKSLSIMDSLIATQAMAANAVLVTADRAFGHVPGLRVENWAA